MHLWGEASPYIALGRLSNNGGDGDGDGDGDGNENGKEATGLDWQNNNFERASRFFVHFFAVASRLQRKNA